MDALTLALLLLHRFILIPRLRLRPRPRWCPPAPTSCSLGVSACSTSSPGSTPPPLLLLRPPTPIPRPTLRPRPRPCPQPPASSLSPGRQHRSSAPLPRLFVSVHRLSLPSSAAPRWRWPFGPRVRVRSAGAVREWVPRHRHRSRQYPPSAT
ncbi:hypothetical protein B0H12DRAFT_444944 [Mycena haematopus]|nr:hypothetical protein B0H12DRAFT_444944 [Mycena haematopus]